MPTRLLSVRGVFTCLLSVFLTPGGNAAPNPVVAPHAPEKEQALQEQQPAKQPSSGENAQEKASLGFHLQDGTPVKLRFTRALSSKDAKAGDRVELEAAEEVKVRGVVVIQRGGVASAAVTKSERRKRLGRGGKLNLMIYNVLLTSGETAPLRAVKDTQGGGHVGAMTGAIVGTTVLFFPAAPLFLLIRGKDSTIPKGTEITAYINGDILLDPAKFGNSPEGKTDPPLAPPAPPAGPASMQPGASRETTAEK